MRVIRLDEVPMEPFYGPTPTIGVGNIKTQPIVTDSKDYLINMVHFDKRARNKFHKHTCDQVLIVTAGNGVVATDEGEVTVKAGEIIYVPACEKHWHGATKDSEFSHIYILSADNKTTQLED